MADRYNFGKPKDRLSLEPASYEVSTDIGIRFQPMVHVWDDSNRNSLVSPFYLRIPPLESEDVANAYAMREAQRWIDEGRPPIDQVGY